jgi:hypothetical protein
MMNIVAARGKAFSFTGRLFLVCLLWLPHSRLSGAMLWTLVCNFFVCKHVEKDPCSASRLELYVWLGPCVRIVLQLRRLATCLPGSYGEQRPSTHAPHIKCHILQGYVNCPSTTLCVHFSVSRKLYRGSCPREMGRVNASTLWCKFSVAKVCSSTGSTFLVFFLFLFFLAEHYTRQCIFDSVLGAFWALQKNSHAC